MSWASWWGGCVRFSLSLVSWCGFSGSSSLAGHFQVVVVDSVDWFGSRAASVKEGVLGDLLVGGFGGLAGSVFPCRFRSGVLFTLLLWFSGLGFRGHFIRCGGGLRVGLSSLAGVVTVVVLLIRCFILVSIVGEQYYT